MNLQRIETWGMGLTLSILMATQVLGISTPLQIAAGRPVLNEFGQIMPGSATDDPSTRPLVLILSAAHGVHPPHLDGSPDALNPIVPHGQVSMGHLVSPFMENSGLFAATLAEPRPSGAIFARVYNAPTLEDSLFYADSQVMTVSGNDPLFAYVGPMTNIISKVRDTDADSIPDYWEHLKFGEATAADPQELVANQANTMLEAFIAGLDPFDTEAYFFISTVAPIYDGESVVGHILQWPSVAERLYDVEYSTNLLHGTFQPVQGGMNLPATPTMNIHTNFATPNEGSVYYRVRVKLANE